MREALAEQLLASVMGWGIEDVARERPVLQAMATYKYDEYQQFSPGMRFVESLALWLKQFSLARERKAAYDFIKARLVFVSAAELAHLVSITYPDVVRPLLIRRAAMELGTEWRFVKRIAASSEFAVLGRRCLFLGLSDGAHVDVFRRSAGANVSNEQVWHTYDITPEKADGMLRELEKDLQCLLGREPSATEKRFRSVFLMDDFSGSGLSCLRERTSDGRCEGKLARFHEKLRDPNGPVAQLVSPDDLELHIVFYVSTEKSLTYLEDRVKKLFSDTGVDCSIHAVQRLPQQLHVDNCGDPVFLEVVDKYYDAGVMDEHLRTGGTPDVKKGFAACGLPLVLTHNTPNDSIYLLWAERDPPGRVPIGLFPRISRHRSEE